MRICLLTSQNLDADPFPDNDWPCDPRPFLPDAEWTLTVLRKGTAVRKVIKRVREGYDVYFNLCDGAWDENAPGIEVVQTLERLGVPFTGATSEFYEPSREALKRACRAWGIDTPAYVFAESEADADRALERLRFPMIVKHPSSYASIGLVRASRVESPTRLRGQVRRMLRSYGGALVEEFVEGGECTVLVAENPDDPNDPKVYSPVQYRFPDGESFKHSHVKWIEYDGMQTRALDDAELATRIREDAAKAFVALHGASFGRCDFRIDERGRPFLLEVNANCGVYYPPEDAGGADLCLMQDPEGHAGFTKRLVAAALARHARQARCWRVDLRPDGEYGLFASRPIQPGETIVRWEDEPHVLVSEAHVREHWTEPMRSRFYRWAWPLNGDVWVTWSRDPDEWRPIHHACDPNAARSGATGSGLDVVARRPIQPGAEITLDFATFHDNRMPPFECKCGSPACRGKIHGSHLYPAVRI